MDYILLRNQAKTVNQLHFLYGKKYMATLVDSSVLNTRVLYVKGAPEIVMGKCNLEESRVKQYNEQLLAYQNQAMRTLGVAYKVIPENSSTDCAELEGRRIDIHGNFCNQ